SIAASNPLLTLERLLENLPTLVDCRACSQQIFGGESGQDPPWSVHAPQRRFGCRTSHTDPRHNDIDKDPWPAPIAGVGATGWPVSVPSINQVVLIGHARRGVTTQGSAVWQSLAAAGSLTISRRPSRPAHTLWRMLARAMDVSVGPLSLRGASPRK